MKNDKGDNVREMYCGSQNNYGNRWKNLDTFLIAAIQQPDSSKPHLD